ncbi:hypothetical protein K0M31_017868 [Melipona bicolor]|uniref:Uncharacterized protein n=1 Tax=Melipona bicolor TaxID=60889 RepID=A0AA40G5R2_9HYME|nr:hypothetical protein K0M31_017868 [Melipona bicolor]
MGGITYLWASGTGTEANFRQILLGNNVRAIGTPTIFVFWWMCVVVTVEKGLFGGWLSTECPGSSWMETAGYTGAGFREQLRD